ncbi:MAG: hypothetical protein AAGA48_28630 [Myxococcota bacterium]
MTIAQVTHEIALLGTTPEEIASTLEALERKGVPGRAGECVLARHLQALGADDAVVCMDGLDHVEVRWGEDLSNMVKGTDGIDRFVAEFDGGKHRNLVQSWGV